MAKSLSFLAIIIGAALLIPRPVAAAESLGATAHPFPSSRGKILIFTDQLPSNMTDPQWRFAATHYVGTQKETTNWAIRIRRLNPNFIILHYQLAVGIGSADFLVGNRWTNDLAVVQRHPHWFLHTATGAPIEQQQYHWDVMNILFQNGHPVSGFPHFWVQTCLQRMRENLDDGCFADSYTQDILMNQTKPPFQWFSSVEDCKTKWLSQLNQYGAYCEAALHAQPEHFYYLPNLGGLVCGWDNTTNYAVGDGGMNEGFCIVGPTQYWATSDWRLQMRRLLALSRQGKILICQSYITPDNPDQRWFVVGSYLLIKGNRTYLNMFRNNSLEWYPQYDAPLGDYSNPPHRHISSYWRPDWGVYRRRYRNGIVLVNPSDRTVSIPNLGRAYNLVVAAGGGPIGPDGNPAGSLKEVEIHGIEIPAHSARCLLYR